MTTTPRRRRRLRPGPNDDGESAEKKRRVENALSMEIVSFTKSMSLNCDEMRMREDLKRKLSRLINEWWPGATVKQFGSHENGLEWFQSDMDLRVRCSLPADAACVEFRDELLSRPSRRVRRVEARPHARVPIVCFEDCETSIQVDVSFDGFYVSDDNDSADSNFFPEPHPYFRDIVLVLKALIKDNENMDKPFYGGVGSFRLAVLVDHFLKKKSTTESCGDALVEFLKHVVVFFRTTLSVTVYSKDRRRSLRVSYANVNSAAFKRICARAADRLSSASRSGISGIFPKGTWDRLVARRRADASLAQQYCQTIQTAAIPPPTSYSPPPAEKRRRDTSNAAAAEATVEKQLTSKKK